jgi:hypothetical protein
MQNFNLEREVKSLLEEVHEKSGGPQWNEVQFKEKKKKKTTTTTYKSS